MKYKIVLAVMVVIIATANVWLAKLFTPAFQIPKTIAEEAADFVIDKLPTIDVVENTNLYEEGTVVAVIDGDTIDVEIGGVVRRVRYIGIDTPEKYNDTGMVECFAIEATTQNESLVLGQTVRLKKDVSEVDRYDRLLRYVYVGENCVNMSLIVGGYARATTFPPDVAKAAEFKKAETIARDSEIGLWSVCE